MSRLKGGANGVALLSPNKRLRNGSAGLNPSAKSRRTCSSFQQAIETARRHRIAYWDAAILAAAVRASAPIVYSEDLGHGQSYGDVQVINPFLK